MILERIEISKSKIFLNSYILLTLYKALQEKNPRLDPGQCVLQLSSSL